MTRKILLFILVLILSLHVEGSNFLHEGDSLKTKTKSYKNKISLEIIGNPLSLSYEREFYNNGKISLAGHLSLNPPVILDNLPGFSIGMNTNVTWSKRWSFFALTKFDALTLSFPTKSWHYWKQGDLFSENLMSLNMGTGFCYRKNHLEIAPIYPCFMYSIGLVGDGDDGWEALYPSISLCTKISYRF